jgi:hypothetical protein
MRSRPFPGLAAFALAVLLTGCSSGPPEGVDLTNEEWSAMSRQQQDAVEDGAVTEREYTAGYEAYVSCLAERGYTVEELGRPSTTYQFGVPDAAVVEGADGDCYESHFHQIDDGWQVAHPSDDEQVKVILRRCLEAEGLDTEGTEIELAERIDASALGYVGCLDGFG